jgi:hypothetical protein
MNCKRSPKITKDQEERVLRLLESNNMKCTDIAELVGVTTNQVYEVKKRYSLSNKINKTFKFSALQEQILISGKLGDGNYKSNGKIGCYYRESHAEPELDYLKWKADILKEFLTPKGIIKVKNFKHDGSYNVNQTYYFMTRTSSSFNRFRDMSIEECIESLNQYGLVLLLLDDGWTNFHNNKNGYSLGLNIAGGTLTNSQLNLLCEKFKQYGIEKVNIVGNIRCNLSISSKYTEKILNMILEIMPIETDIIQKKFKYMV